MTKYGGYEPLERYEFVTEGYVAVGERRKMQTVTKKDVAKGTAQLLNEKIYTTEKVVDSVFASLREIMANAEDEVRIEIREFGVFEVKKTKPKPKARNPRTGEIISVPARKKTHFKAGKMLKEILKKPLPESEIE